MAASTPPKTGGAGRSVVWVLAGTVAVAACGNLILDLPGAVGVGPSPMSWEHRVAVIGLNASIMWSVVLLVLAVTGRFWPTVCLSLVGPVLVAFANMEKLRFRLEPLYPTDFLFAKEPTFLLTVVEGGHVGVLVVLVGTVVAFCILGHRLTRGVFRPLRSLSDSQRNRWLALRVTTAVVTVAIILQAAHFSNDGNRLKSLYRVAGVDWQSWSQVRNYETNGFIAGFLWNLDNPIMTRPPGYDRATMMELARFYTDRARVTNRGKHPNALRDVNVVLVLSESFTDPLQVSTVELAEDPIPFIRDLFRTTTSGSVLAQSYGGGTANMEFSALTGQSLTQFTPQTNTPYQQVVPQFDEYPSAAGMFSRMGHRTVAIHPYLGEMYMRDDVYPRLGFDSFITRDDFGPLSTVTRFIEDADAFDVTLQQLDTHEEPVFVNLVTMQNHVPYQDEYKNPIAVAGAQDADEGNSVGNYARGLKITDSAVRDFLSRLSTSDEKTVVLFYGDHHPSVWSDRTRALLSERALRHTPFFVWSNFKDRNAQRPPTTSANQFMNFVFDEADAPIPPFYALLLDLQAEVPALEPGLMIGPDDDVIDPAELSDRAKRLLRDYRLVQYDFSVGRRYAVDDMFYSADNPSVRASD